MAGVSQVATDAVVIPTSRGGSQSFTQRTELDGHEYVLTFDWMERAGSWFISLADTDETPIISGKRLTVGTDLLGTLSLPARPQGQIICVEVSGRLVDPGLDDLGVSHQVLYVTSVGSYLGTWDYRRTYARADVVRFNGVTYFSLQDGNLLHAPWNSPAWWVRWENGREVPS